MPTKKQAAVAWILGLVLFAAGVSPAQAFALGPELINYQGVLRDAAGQPLNGTFELVFTFYSSATGGDEIMLDQHTFSQPIGQQITVTNGLFNVALGSGLLTDGSGSGSYTSLALMFQNYSTVFLEVRVGTETLSPRTRILSAAYALNAHTLDGLATSKFVRTDAIGPQIVGGGLRLTGASTSIGLEATGISEGVWAKNFYGTAQAFLAEDIPGGSYGVEGIGNTAGGLFEGLYSHAYVGGGSGAKPNWGIEGVGSYDPAAGTGGGALFYDTGPGNTGVAKLGIENYGVQGLGSTMGGYFNDTNSGSTSFVGYDVYKIQGNGLVAFVQNHPSDSSKVIVYGAPEGPEAATYTRGTAKLVNGEARIALDPTFALVTNPDIGLTAHVTPRGRPAVVYTESVTTSELIVKSNNKKSEGVTIDYLVYGLRIGFEQAAVIQPKQREAMIPSMATQRALLTKQPELVQYTALSHFLTMRTGVGTTSALNLSAAQALHDAIGEFDPAVHGSLTGRPSNPSARTPEDVLLTPPGGVPPGLNSTATAGVLPERPLLLPPAEGADAPPRHARVDLVNVVPVSERVEAGEVLVSAADGSGLNHLGDVASDRGVVGIVFGDPGQIYSGSAPLAQVGTVVTCRVDATFAPIGRGDFLATSPTMGQAMKSPDGAPGTIIGKALESLASGTGSIKVLVMPR